VLSTRPRPSATGTDGGGMRCPVHGWSIKLQRSSGAPQRSMRPSATTVAHARRRGQPGRHSRPPCHSEPARDYALDHIAPLAMMAIEMARARASHDRLRRGRVKTGPRLVDESGCRPSGFRTGPYIVGLLERNANCHQHGASRTDWRVLRPRPPSGPPTPNPRQCEPFH
jgi:hypothetical protein